MKKLLSLLGAVVLTASASTAVVSCSYGPNIDKAVKREMQFYSQVSAEALKAGILADQNLNIAGQTDVGINTDFATTYVSSKSVAETFGKLYDPNQGARPDATSEVSTLFDTVFGTNQGGYHYTVADSYGSLAANNGVKPGTNLAKLVADRSNTDATKEDNSRLLQPSASIASTLNLVSGIANIVFKNDFDPSMGETLISLLTSGTVKGALDNDQMPGLFKTIDQVLTNNATAISDIVNNITQSNTAKLALNNRWTYADVIKKATEDLFAGLIYFVSDQKFKYVLDNDSADSSKTSEATAHANDAITDFFSFLLSGNTDDLQPAKAVDSDNNNYVDLLESISDFARFGITMVHYFRQFDALFPKMKTAPIDGDHIFDFDNQKITNADAVGAVMNTQYVSASGQSDDFWFVNDKGVYSSKLNLQNLISDLQFFFSPSGEDKGYQMLRMLTMVLGGPSEDQFSPVVENVISALKKVITSKQVLTNIINQKLPWLGKLVSVDALVDVLWEILQTSASDLISWFTSDGDDPLSGSVVNIIQQLTGILKAIPLSQFANDDNREILEIVDGIIQYLNKPQGANFYAHPWSTIFTGHILVDVGSIMRSVAKDDKHKKEVMSIGNALIQLRDLKTILKKPLGNIFAIIRSMITDKKVAEKIQIPDFLYSGKDMSVSQLFDYLAKDWLVYTQDAGTKAQTNHDSDEYNSLSENKYYTFNTQSIANLIDGLIPASSDDTTKTRILDDSGNYVTPIMPLYYAIMNYGQAIKQGSLKYIDKDGKEKVTKSYSVELAGDDNKHEILGDTPFDDKDSPQFDPNSPSQVSVSSQAFEYLLGVDDTTSSSKLFFRPGSLLMGVSNLYGHWYGPVTGSGSSASQKVTNDEVPLTDKQGNPLDETANANANASESIFNLLSDVAAFATKSIDNLTKDDYAGYFDPKNWKIANVTQHGLDAIAPDVDDMQQLDYDLSFYNPDKGRTYTYHVMMQRRAVEETGTSGNSDTGWVVKQLMLQN